MISSREKLLSISPARSVSLLENIVRYVVISRAKASSIEFRPLARDSLHYPGTAFMMKAPRSGRRLSKLTDFACQMHVDNIDMMYTV